MAVKLFHKVYPNPNSTDYLIILHGLFGMLDNWHNMANMISQYVNVVTVDQRNHGQSPHTNTMNFESMAEDLRLLLDDLNISSAIVLGHSMGGKAAMVFADIYPSRVTKLIIVDIAPKKYQAGHQLYFNAFKTIDFSKFNRRQEADEALAKLESNIGIRQFLLKNLDRSEQGYKLKFNLAAIEEFYPDMIKELKFQWLITIPTLFVYGGNSGYISEDDKLDILESFPNAEFIKIPDAGHWVHAEQPLPFFEAVRHFIA